MALRRRWKPAEIQDRSGAVAVTVNARLWRTTGQTTSTGQRYDFRGVCDEAAATALVGQQNMILVFIGGESYRIVDAIHHEHLGYLELSAIQASNQG